MKSRYDLRALFYNYIVDYMTSDGKYMHQVLKVLKTDVESSEAGAIHLNNFLKEQGYKPYAIVEVKGNLTFEQLEAIASGKVHIPLSAYKRKYVEFT